MPDAENKIAKSQKAREILENPFIQDFIRNYRARIHSEWEKTEAQDKEGREFLYLLSRCLERFVLHFNQYITDGEMEKFHKELKEKQFGVF